MERLSAYFLLGLIFSCNSITQKRKDKVDIIKKYGYCITLSIWNGFYKHDSKFILNNLQIENYDSSDQSPLTKPLNLYHISKEDTTQVVFSKLQSDTLFNLTADFFKTFSINNYDTAINNVVTKPYITDDSHANVEIEYGGRKLKATLNSINNPTVSTKEFEKLETYVESFFTPTK